MSVYLDCNATTPPDPRVVEEMLRYLRDDYGNAGSSTHAYGARARRAVETARGQVAAVVGARRHEVIFTSGATESNNLALLGLATHGERVGRRHIVSTRIEHKAVLEPLDALRRRGFEVTLVAPRGDGWVEPAAVREAVRGDTLLVSVMQVNNETGVRQPVEEIAESLAGLPVFFHVDAAQGFGKELDALRHPRIDLVSVSGHKVYGPKGVGALIARRRKFELPPLEPLLYGGGQEFGLRPGTLPVHLIAGLGKAAELALGEWRERALACGRFRRELLEALEPLHPVVHGDPGRTLPHVLNISIPGVDSEDAMEALDGIVAVSNGSACTSVCATASHVLTSMGLPQNQVDSALRFSWYHGTERPDFARMTAALRGISRAGKPAAENASPPRTASPVDPKAP